MYVRKFFAEDREAVRDICYRTGYMGASADRFWRHRDSFTEICLAYFMDREPESLYVAVRDEPVVGYLTGCVDTSAAPNPERLFAAQIRKHRLLFRPGTAGFLWRGILEGILWRRTATGGFIDPRWPSHLHITLLPEARGCGLGRLLMERWFERLRSIGSPGCHLSTLAENSRAVGFFTRMGFRCYGEPLPVPGLRGPTGERLHQQIMVREMQDDIRS